MRASLVVALSCVGGVAFAQPVEPTTPAPAEPPLPGDTTAPSEPDNAHSPTGLHEDNEFGPVIQIEAIEITGNTATDADIIRRAIRLAPGDVLHASDHRLRDVRFQVLALGFFREVTLAMHKGSQRGRIVIEVHVVERGTIVLNRLWFGHTVASPWWVGADVGERNLLGLGISVGGGFLYARHGDIPSSRDQYAGEVRVGDPSLRGSRWGVNGAATFVHGSEPYRIAGESGDAGDFHAFDYSRIGGRANFTYDATPLTRLTGGVRFEDIDAHLPVAPTVTLPDGRLAGVDLHLVPGRSYVTTLSFGFDRDTRPDPILPHAGGHVLAAAEVGSSALGGSYDYATVFARYEHYWPLFSDKQAIAIKLAGGVVIGNAPRFDRIYIADVDRMLTPRALGMTLSTASPLDILGTRDNKPTYGDLGGTATVEYAVQLFRGSGKNRVYGGDVFFGAGVWGLADTDELRARDSSLWKSLPVDLYADAGLRIDTDIGIFELTIANALGRLR
ncbi:MAG TPA: BamA/TamA family outer membrane protein [Kofleriaceae bacterium]|jgi:outer membrane protein assembly factor BamA